MCMYLSPYFFRSYVPCVYTSPPYFVPSFICPLCIFVPSCICPLCVYVPSVFMSLLTVRPLRVYVPSVCMSPPCVCPLRVYVLPYVYSFKSISPLCVCPSVLYITYVARDPWRIPIQGWLRSLVDPVTRLLAENLQVGYRQCKNQLMSECILRWREKLSRMVAI